MPPDILPGVKLDRTFTLRRDPAARELPWLTGPSPSGPTKWVWTLSGGAADGAFQVGAALALMRDVRFAPSGFAGTSVGSVNALALAEGGLQGAWKLRDLWLSLYIRDGMYEWEPWVERLDSVLRPHGIKIKLLLGRIAGTGGHIVPPSLPQLLILDGLTLDLFRLFSSLGAAGFIPSVLTLGIAPLVLLGGLADAGDRLIASIEQAASILSDESTGLWNFNPLRRIADRHVDPAALSAAELPVRFVVVGLGDGRAYNIKSNSELLVLDDNAVEGRLEFVPVGRLDYPDSARAMIESALASSAIPLVNPPHDLPIRNEPGVRHNQAFIDGGVRDNLPVEAAVAMFDDELADSDSAPGVLAILSNAAYIDQRDFIYPELNPFRTAETDDRDDFNLFSTAELAFSALLDEVAATERRKVQRNLPESFRRMLIAPSINVSAPNPLDPGMTQILLAYGYMTAFDQMQYQLRSMSWEEYREALWQSTNKIIQTRLLCWQLEREGSPLFQTYWMGESSRVWPVEVGLNEFSYLPFVADPIDTLRTGDDADWILGNDSLERLRDLKLVIRDEVLERVRNHGLRSLPDFHDMSAWIPSGGNVNLISDWWNRFERHGWEPDSRGQTGPGLISNFSSATGHTRLFGDARYTSIYSATLLARTRTTPWDGALVWMGAPLQGSQIHIRAPQPLTPTPLEIGPDYCVVQLEGYVLETATHGEWSRRLVQAKGGETPNHLLTTEMMGRALDVPPEYATTRLSGYVFSPSSTPPDGTVPLVRWHSALLHDHLATASLRFLTGHNVSDFEPLPMIEGSYTDPVILGYIYSPSRPQPPGTIPLYRWFSPSGWDHMTTTEEVVRL